jgi:hypothetical protein
LQAETVRREQEEAKVADLTQRNAQLAETIAAETAEHERTLRREAELKHSLQERDQQLGESQAVTAKLESELKKLRMTLDDMNIIQSALCDKVRHLTAQQDVDARRINDLESESSAREQVIRSRDRELAALRFAVLEAERFSDSFNRQRRQAESNVVEGWKQTMETLLQTPLLATQRSVITSLSRNLESWQQERETAPAGVEFRVEAPDFAGNEFNLREAIEGALAEVRRNASVQATVDGWLPEVASGQPQYLHHVITQVAGSLVGMDGVEKLSLTASVKGEQGRAALVLTMSVSAKPGEAGLCAKLAELIETSANCLNGRRTQFDAVWQLVQALGGSHTVEAVGQSAKLEATLPLTGVAEQVSGGALVKV